MNCVTSPICRSSLRNQLSKSFQGSNLYQSMKRSVTQAARQTQISCPSPLQTEVLSGQMYLKSPNSQLMLNTDYFKVTCCSSGMPHIWKRQNNWNMKSLKNWQKQCMHLKHTQQTKSLITVAKALVQTHPCLKEKASPLDGMDGRTVSSSRWVIIEPKCANTVELMSLSMVVNAEGTLQGATLPTKTSRSQGKGK